MILASGLKRHRDGERVEETAMRRTEGMDTITWKRLLISFHSFLALYSPISTFLPLAIKVLDYLLYFPINCLTFSVSFTFYPHSTK